MGNRIYKNSSVSGKQRYIVDIAGKLPTILWGYDPDYSPGYLESIYFYTPAGQILRQDNAVANRSFYYVHDRLGSVRLLTDNCGTVCNSYSYNPFGEDLATETAEQVDNPFKFTGQWYDEEFGQYYLRARQYDPQIMRFTSYDPVFGEPFCPLTLHKYLYCLNNPINRFDPSGELSAAALTEAIMAGYATHALAIAVTAYGVANYDDAAITLGILLEGSIGNVMAMVTAGYDAIDAVVHTARTKFPEKYPYKDKRNLERIISEWDQGMQGDHQFRNDKDPNKRWQRIMLKLLQLFSPEK
jgi:RHS repeat-associated protein